MNIVIQCAAKKHPTAGHLRRRDGRKVMFVADPALAPPSRDHDYACPDDMSDTGVSWRKLLCDYNVDPAGNPLNLLPAWQLYANRTYGLLAQHIGLDRLFILSAGWGLIRADFLTPNYDITFSSSADQYKKRGKKDRYDDLRMRPAGSPEPIVFFGGKDYVALFCALTEGAMGERVLFYNTAIEPEAPGCRLIKFVTKTRTNWHYECANAFISGQVKI